MAEKNAELIASLELKRKNLDEELSRINTEIKKIEHRSFERETPEQKLKKRLAWYKDVASLAEDVSFQQDLKDSESLFNTYSLIIEMYLSLQKEGEYKKEDNDSYKNKLGELKQQLSSLDPAHKDSFKQSFEELSTQVKDYRFTMYELVRVFDLVDEMANNNKDVNGIYSSLRADKETEFIDEIPFTQKLLKDYIKADKAERLNIRKNEPSLETIK